MMSKNPIVRADVSSPTDDRRSYRIYKERIEHKDPLLDYDEHHIIEILVDTTNNEIVMASLINGVFGQDLDALKEELALINKAMSLPVLSEHHIPESAWGFGEDDE